MKAKLFEYTNNAVIAHARTASVNINNPQLILAFGEKELIKTPTFYDALKTSFPKSDIAICSTAGEIAQMEVKDGGAIITALEFAETTICTASVKISDFDGSFEAGKALAKKIIRAELCYVLILSDGAVVNGSELAKGIGEVVPASIPVTGGLAADGIYFQSTGVGLNTVPESGNIIAIGFYGIKLKIGHGSMGGWDVFGPEKTVTRSQSNLLYEIDHMNALELYKEYLGKYANDLPWSALLFPLSLKVEGSSELLVRTILSIDEANQCLVFAGDIPEGAKVRLMKANFDNLIDAASQAANICFNDKMPAEPEFALLISCVGRKLILKSRVEEEVEAVGQIFNTKAVMSGFYSNGELSPFNNEAKCQLHNQTMTITTFLEDLN